MFDDLQRWHAIRRLQKPRDKRTKKYERTLDYAKSHNFSPEEIAKLENEEFIQDTRFEDAIDKENTVYVLKMADRYLVPVPAIPLSDDKGPYWRTSDFVGNVLTRETCITILTAIRAEREGGWKQIERWITWTIALIGALTGFVAILKK
jgi:hypothetical protein